MYTKRYNSKPNSTSLAPKPKKLGIKLAYIGLKAADIISSVNINILLRNILPLRLRTPF